MKHAIALSAVLCVLAAGQAGAFDTENDTAAKLFLRIPLGGEEAPAPRLDLRLERGERSGWADFDYVEPLPRMEADLEFGVDGRLLSLGGLDLGRPMPALVPADKDHWLSPDWTAAGPAPSAGGESGASR